MSAVCTGLRCSLSERLSEFCSLCSVHSRSQQLLILACDVKVKFHSLVLVVCWLHIQLPVVIKTALKLNWMQKKVVLRSAESSYTHIIYKWCNIKEKDKQATDIQLAHMLPPKTISNQPHIKVARQTHIFVFRAELRVRPDLYSVCSDTLLPHQIVRKFKHTHWGKIASYSQETELVLEFSPKCPWMTSEV